MSDSTESELATALVGATVRAIHISEDYLTFDTDRGLVTYTVEGDCCSHSYFFDFYGVEHLLKNGAVTAFESVGLSPGDVGYHAPTWTVPEDAYDEVVVYGFRLTTEHPGFGSVTSVFSFRNSSNGYYGGWMYLTEGAIHAGQRQLTADITEVES